MKHFSTTILIILCLGSTLLLSGCPQKIELFQENLADSSKELGSVHITLLPPLLFEEYKNTIQPNFAMTADKALNEAVPITMSRYSFDGRSTTFSAQVNLPTKSFDKEKTTQLEDEVETVTRTDKEMEKSGDVPDVETEPGTLSDSTFPITNAELAIDPLLKYWTATAIYQEVQLINHYFKSMSLDTDYVPYIVRLQVTTLPKMRNAPYDTFVDIFFSNASSDEEEDKALVHNRPVIFPMLVTDNLESQMNKLSVEQVKDLALALKGMVKGVGFGTSLTDYHKLIKAALGRDYNSLLTVARFDNNALRVRIGAMQQAASAYSIIPRNHIISLIVMVPKVQDKVQNRTLQGRATYTFTNTHTGVPLLLHSNDESVTDLPGRIKEVVEEAGFQDVNDEKIKEILNVVLTQRPTSELKAILFDKEASKKENVQNAKISNLGFATIQSVPVAPIQKDNLQNLEDFEISRRLDLINQKFIGAARGFNYEFFSVRIPDSTFKPLCIQSAQNHPQCEPYALWLSESDKVSLLDDGEKQSTMSLAPVGNIRDTRVFARLIAHTTKGAKITFPAKKITTNPSSNELVLTFDSLAPWGLKNSKKLQLYDFHEDKSHSTYNFLNLAHTIKTEKDALGLTFINKNGNDFIVVEHGKKDGSVHIQLKGRIDTDNYVSLVVEKARFIGDTAQILMGEKRTDDEKTVLVENIITGIGKTELKLSNLVHDQKVKIFGLAKDKRNTNILEFTVKMAGKSTDSTKQ